MAAYLTVAELKGATLAPASYVDAIEAEEPGWTLGRLTTWSAWIDARLRKRYAAPFATPYPVTVTGWLAAIVTWEIYLKRGVNALDQQATDIRELATAAKAEVLEAANAVGGLFDLPLRANTTATGIALGEPLGYSEASPYTWTSEQRDAAIAAGEL